MSNTYAPITDFGQYVEFVTQAAPDINGFCDIVINTVPLADLNLSDTDGDPAFKLNLILSDYAKVLAIKNRLMNLTSAQLNAVIPTAMRTRINVWLTARGWTNVPNGWTYLQLFNAIKTRVS